MSPRTRALPLLTVVAVLAGLVVVPSAAAAPGGAEKVRICHRTNALTNPYVSIVVDRDSVDGNAGNDKGKGDHYLNHTGPVWTPQSTKKDDWGDIIPPIPGIHDGRNWNEEGQAIWSAGCYPANLSDTDEDGVPDIDDPDTDGDTIPDTVDTDDDGDKTPDVSDPDEQPTIDTDGDRVPDPVDSDDDGDGVRDDSDCVVAVAEGECDSSGNVIPPKDDTPNPDKDGDNVPNRVDPDDDGDGNPDVTDPDDDNDRIPDVLDPDTSNPDPVDELSTDTDDDGVPDVTDRDDDGDGIPDTRDRDADGNGQPEDTDQPLASGPLPARIAAGEPVVLWRDEPLTVIGGAARGTVRCSPAFRGDVVGGTRSLCDISQSPTKGTVTVRAKVPTIVTVVFTAPARGEYRSLREVRTYRVTP